MSNIVIDKGVPVPPSNVSRRKYPFDAMEVGDSFFVAGRQHKVYGAINWHTKHSNKRFTTRKVVENGVAGIRVWRVS